MYEKLDRKCLLILSHLRMNARRNLTYIAKQTQIPISTIFEKLRRFERSFIKKHTSIIDYMKLGFAARVKVLVSLPRDERERFQRYLSTHPNVNTLLKVSSNFDFLFEAIFSTIVELNEFLETLEDKFRIKKKEVFYIVEDIKREGFMADADLVDFYLANA